MGGSTLAKHFLSDWLQRRRCNPSCGRGALHTGPAVPVLARVWEHLAAAVEQPIISFAVHKTEALVAPEERRVGCVRVFIGDFLRLGCRAHLQSNQALLELNAVLTLPWMEMPMHEEDRRS